MLNPSYNKKMRFVNLAFNFKQCNMSIGLAGHFACIFRPLMDEKTTKISNKIHKLFIAFPGLHNHALYWKHAFPYAVMHG